VPSTPVPRRPLRSPFVASLATVALLLAAGAAHAAKTHEAELLVTLKPSLGTPLEKKLPASEIKESFTLYEGPNSGETGMSVPMLLGNEGVALDRVESLKVTSSRGGYAMDGKTATEGVQVWGGHVAYAAFRAENGGPWKIVFFWPPEAPGEELSHHDLPGAGETDVSALFEIKGGLLSVSKPIFTPSSPEAGKVVSFVEPSVEYGHHEPLSQEHFAWKFGDDETSNEPSPKHPFALPHGDTSFMFKTEVTVTAKAPQGEVAGSASIEVPVIRGEQPASPPVPPGNSQSSLSGGLPTGPPKGPSNDVLSAKVTKSPQHVAASSSGGHGSGQGSGSGSGTGTANGGAGGGSSAGATAAHAASLGSGPGVASSAPQSPKQSPPQKAQLSPVAPALVGVLLESSPAGLPGSAQSAFSQSNLTGLSLPDAGHGSGNGTNAGGPLAWIAGSLVVLALLAVGAFSELRPLGRRRKLAAG
jgi:hypothetical protein